jgi:lipopolysaccharide export LptBFGC system permease protein LptF
LFNLKENLVSQKNNPKDQNWNTFEVMSKKDIIDQQKENKEINFNHKQTNLSKLITAKNKANLKNNDFSFSSLNSKSEIPYFSTNQIIYNSLDK